MSDLGGGDEANAHRALALGPGVSLDVKLDAPRASVDALHESIKRLQNTLSDFGNNSYRLADSINRHIKSIGDTAAATTVKLNAMNGAIGLGGGGNSGGGGGGGGTYTGGTAGGGGDSSAWTSSATQAIARVTGSGKGSLAGGLSLGTFLGSGDDGFVKDLAMAPLRYLRQRINTNRDTAIMASGGLNMVANQQGVGTAGMMSTLSRFPGSIYGTTQDLLGLFGAAPSLGASYNFANPGQGGAGQGVRAAGLFKGVQQMQMLNPMATVGELTGDLGGYSSNTKAQQRSMMLTGGAMGIIGAGGRQKSLSEWAESIMRWFVGLRSGPMRGKPFSYGDLIAQYFPGSNIDAWFEVNGVPQNMRDYWWTYALAKAQGGNKGDFEIGAPSNNVAWERLRASSETTRTEFGLAGQMAPQYVKREGANRWFNALMGQFQEDIIPRVGGGRLNFIQYLPDALEDLLMTGVERGASKIFGDVGDIGDSYGEMGGTGLSGLHPDMKSKVGAMMKANPRLRMNSGLRDTGLQRKLKAKGHSRVSGKPSAHTRGMAADLGPSSEYGWIMKNAKRFGLASGKSHGEPWHVGMQGDIPGIGDGMPTSPSDIAFDQFAGSSDSMFSDFIDMFGGGNDGPEAMASLVARIMQLFSRGVTKINKMGSGMGGFDLAPNALYDKLVGASSKPGISSGGRTNNALLDGLAQVDSQAAADLGWTPGGTNPSSALGTTAAQALFNAGFKTRKELETITAISWRESGWNPNAKNPHTSDRGLMQINMTANKALMAQMGYTEADLMNPQKNANMAYRIYQNAGGQFWPWGFSEHSSYLDGRPGWDRNGDPLTRTAGSNAAEVVRSSGLPVIGDMETGLAYAPQRSAGTNMIFNNQFNIGSSGGNGSPNGGIDVRRTVVLMADHLEDEMKRRVARTA